MKSLAKLATILLLPCLAVSCQTAKQLNFLSASDSEYNLFYEPDDHVSELLEKRDVLSASTVYNDETAYFRESPEEFSELVDRLSDGLIGYYQKDAERALSKTSPDWPAPPETWRDIRTDLVVAADLIGEIEEHKVLRRPTVSFPAFERLKSSLDATITRITNDAPTQFAAYDLGSKPDFFRQYPVEIDRARFLAAQSRTIVSQINTASPSELLRLHSMYREHLPDDVTSHLTATYFDRSVQEQARRGVSGFKGILTTLESMKDDGMTIAMADHSGIAFIDISSRPSAPGIGHDFPVRFASDLPFNIVTMDVATVFADPALKFADVIVLIDVSGATVTRRIVSKDTVTSEFQSGSRTVPNPAYASAQALVNRQTVDYQRASYDNASCYGLVCIVTALGEIAARKNLDDAMAALSQTPSTLTEPVYSPYSFQVSHIESARQATVAYYVIDRFTNRFHEISLDVKQERSFKVNYGVHPQERRPYVHERNKNDEDQVVAFEEGEFSIALSELLEGFTSDPQSGRPLADVVEIRSTIEGVQRKTVAANQDKTFNATFADHSILQSVVMVHNPSVNGLGSGFYVREDLAVTNHHVIEGAKFVELTLYDGNETFGKVVAQDIRRDLALIKVQQAGEPLTFFSRRSLPIGDPVLAIGHPEGLAFSVTRGIISAIRRDEENGPPVLYIQTDTAMNEGNSGGPLVWRGEVIGVNSFKYSAEKYEGLGFALHYSEVIDFLRTAKY